MFRWLYALLLLVPVLADYDCVCNYNVEEGVFDVASKAGQPVGFLYEFDCKPQAGADSGNFYVVMYEKQLAYVAKNAQVQVQTCPGDIPSADKLTTSAGPKTTPPITTVPPTTRTTTPPTTPTPTTTPTTITTTPTPRTTPTTTRSTTPTTHTTIHHNTLVPTTTATITEGHIEICPAYIKDTDVNRFHGFLGQYGEFCYELVDTPTQWVNAERHCTLVSQGHLVHVLNQEEQDYLVRFLSKHHYVKGVWIGLTDSGSTGQEGTWRWSSGETYHYNNFQGDYAQHSANTHKLNDCLLFKQGGEWTDASCGTSLFAGLGFGETHPYICQYNVSSSLPSIIDALPNAVVG